MINFFLFHPMGETLLLLVLALFMYFAHKRGWVKGRAAWDVAVFAIMTVVGFWNPLFFFFALALAYTVWRLNHPDK